MGLTLLASPVLRVKGVFGEIKRTCAASCTGTKRKERGWIVGMMTMPMFHWQILKNDSHSIAPPPPELVEKWECEYHHMTCGPDLSMFISEKAASWGADVELDACCEWASQFNYDDYRYQDELRSLRRSKPKNEADEALAEIQDLEGVMYSADLGWDFTVIRAALEHLRELEQSNG